MTAPNPTTPPEPDHDPVAPPPAPIFRSPPPSAEDDTASDATELSQTAAAVAYWHAHDPTLRSTQIAKRVSCSVRHVRRILATLDNTDTPESDDRSPDVLADANRYHITAPDTVATPAVGRWRRPVEPVHPLTAAGGQISDGVHLVVGNGGQHAARPATQIPRAASGFCSVSLRQEWQGEDPATYLTETVCHIPARACVGARRAARIAG